jgi:hypothetical protein
LHFQNECENYSDHFSPCVKITAANHYCFAQFLARTLEESRNSERTFQRFREALYVISLVLLQFQANLSRAPALLDEADVLRLTMAARRLIADRFKPSAARSPGVAQHFAFYSPTTPDSVCPDPESEQ